MGFPRQSIPEALAQLATIVRRALFLIDRFPSHLYASFGLARRLEKIGCAVEYWGELAAGAVVKSQGLNFRPLDGLWSRWPDELHALRQVPGVLMQETIARRRRAPQVRDSIRRVEQAIDLNLLAFRPDLVIFDPFLLGYGPFFFQRGMPAVVLSTKAPARPDAMVPPYTSALIPGEGLSRRALVRLAWLGRRMSYRTRHLAILATRYAGVYMHEHLVAEIAQQTNFPLDAQRVVDWLPFDLHFRSIPEWVLWLPEMDLPRAQPLPNRIKYIGPSVDLERVKRQAPVTRAAGQKFVYVSVGTMQGKNDSDVRFLSKIIEAFRALPDIAVVISAATKPTLAALPAPPPNVRTFAFLPQLQLLDSADLMITHGGAGTYRECIVKQVPMLVYPRNGDQFGNSARIVFHGAGLRGRRLRVTPASIRRNALRILGDATFRWNIRQIRKDLDHYDSDAFLCTALDDAINQPGIVSRSGPVRPGTA
jgi:zeaxanthin glucosyltransferase